MRLSLAVIDPYEEKAVVVIDTALRFGTKLPSILTCKIKENNVEYGYSQY